MLRGVLALDESLSYAYTYPSLRYYYWVDACFDLSYPDSSGRRPSWLRAMIAKNSTFPSHGFPVLFAVDGSAMAEQCPPTTVLTCFEILVVMFLI